MHCSNSQVVALIKLKWLFIHFQIILYQNQSTTYRGAGAHCVIDLIEAKGQDKLSPSRDNLRGIPVLVMSDSVKLAQAPDTLGSCRSHIVQTGSQSLPIFVTKNNKKI